MTSVAAISSLLSPRRRGRRPPVRSVRSARADAWIGRCSGRAVNSSTTGVTVGDSSAAGSAAHGAQQVDRLRVRAGSRGPRPQRLEDVLVEVERTHHDLHAGEPRGRPRSPSSPRAHPGGMRTSITTTSGRPPARGGSPPHRRSPSATTSMSSSASSSTRGAGSSPGRRRARRGSRHRSVQRQGVTRKPPPGGSGLEAAADHLGSLARR